MQKHHKLFTLILPAILTTALWGSAVPCIKVGYALFGIGSDSFSQLVFAGWRFAMAGILTLLIALLIGKRRIAVNRSNIGAILSICLFQSMIQYVCYYIGLSHTTGTKGALLSGTQTFFAILFAHIFLTNDKLTLTKTIGCLMGFSGVLLLQLGGDLGGFSLMGDGLVLLSAASAGMGALVSRVMTPGRDPMVLTGWQLTLGGIFLLALGYGGGGSIGTLSIKGCLLMLYLVILSSAAFTIWTTLLKKWPVGTVSLYGFLIPVFGAILSAIFLSERSWTLQSWCALGLVSTGIAAANYTKKTKDIIT